MDMAALVEKRFARLRAQYSQRKSLAESQAETWYWATREVWDLNPLYFEMNGARPGQKLSAKPARLDGAFAYATDASGRIVIEREYSDFGPSERFIDWSKSPLEVAYFAPQKSPINLKLASFRGDKLFQIATAAEYSVSMETYHWHGPLLTRIEIRYADRKSSGLEKMADYQEVHAAYDSDGQVKRVEIHWLPRPPHVHRLEKEVVFKRRDKPVAIDLRKDAVDIQRMLAEAVGRYTARHMGSATAKKYPPVSRIHLVFSLGDSRSTPWVHLDFDTKPGSEPDGDPTHPHFVKLARKGWHPAVKAVCHDEEAKVTQTNGKTIKCGDAELTETIAEFLVDSLLEARAKGVFADLPKAARCELGVEDIGGGKFGGWPAYEDRGKKNLVK
jgi:hypothetical protein